MEALGSTRVLIVNEERQMTYATPGSVPSVKVGGFPAGQMHAVAADATASKPPSPEEPKKLPFNFKHTTDKFYCELCHNWEEESFFSNVREAAEDIMTGKHRKRVHRMFRNGSEDTDPQGHTWTSARGFLQPADFSPHSPQRV